MAKNGASIGLPTDPIQGILAWLSAAEKAGVPEPTAMTLATATPDGIPSARIVLFKKMGHDSRGRQGLRFFTNYASRKSLELAANPRAALVFHWPEQHRQIRIEGTIEKLSPGESNIYFQSRPRGSRIGAWASPQSQTINERDDLLRLVAEVESRFKDDPIPCPDFWGGWILTPSKIEFWQKADFRLHDRFLYERTGNDWKVDRLAP